MENFETFMLNEAGRYKTSETQMKELLLSLGIVDNKHIKQALKIMNDFGHTQWRIGRGEIKG